MTIKKIVIIGPESTGKSMLCKNLASYFKADWVKEYAREYLEKNGTHYTAENLYEIAMGQINCENEGIKIVEKNASPHTNNTPLFIDTNLYVIKVWSEFVFNKCDNRILKEIASRKYDGYILCNTDIPWVKDNLREYPSLETREKLFHFYKAELVEQQAPWVIINGNYEHRTKQAIDFVNTILSTP